MKLAQCSDYPKSIRVFINGFGRVGRAIVRVCLQDPYIEIVGINDANLTSNEIAYLCKYDSIYGRLNTNVHLDKNTLSVDDSFIKLFQDKNIYHSKPNCLNQLDFFVDSTGDLEKINEKIDFFKDFSFKTILTTYVESSKVKFYNYISNSSEYNFSSLPKTISLGTCDSSAILPICIEFNETFDCEAFSIVTLHPYLNNQNLLDGKSPSSDIELGRAALNNLIPKSTSLESILKNLIPNKAEKIMAMSFRVPTSTVTQATLHISLSNAIDTLQLQAILASWCDTKWKGLGHYSKERCVSSDYSGSPYSFIIDHNWIKVVNKQIRLSVWYDNEWGYAALVLSFLKTALRSEMI